MLRWVRNQLLEHEARSGAPLTSAPNPKETAIRPLFDLVERRLDAHTRLVAPRGELDAATNPAFRAAVQGHPKGGEERLVLDLSEVSFMSAGPIEVIASACRERGRGQLVVICPSPRLYRLFEITGLTGKLDIVASREGLAA